MCSPVVPLADGVRFLRVARRFRGTGTVVDPVSRTVPVPSRARSARLSGRRALPNLRWNGLW